MKMFLLFFCIMELPILAYWLYVAFKGPLGASAMDRFKLNVDVWSFIALGMVTLFIAIFAMAMSFGFILINILSQ